MKGQESCGFRHLLNVNGKRKGDMEGGIQYCRGKCRLWKGWNFQGHGLLESEI